MLEVFHACPCSKLHLVGLLLTYHAFFLSIGCIPNLCLLWAGILFYLHYGYPIWIHVIIYMRNILDHYPWSQFATRNPQRCRQQICGRQNQPAALEVILFTSGYAANGGFLSHWGTPSPHPFIDGISCYKPSSELEVPWLWKPPNDT